MARDLVSYIDGEPWLDNSRLFILNRSRARRRKKGKVAMAYRRRRRSRVRVRARSNRRRTYRRTFHTRRRRRARRNFPALMANPRHRRRRHYRMNRRSFRRARRNPFSVAGLNWMDLLKGAGAVIVSPMLEKQIMPLLPASISGTTYGRWGVKIGAAIGTWYVAKAAFGGRSAEVVAIALGATLLADAATEFLPSLTGHTAAYLPQGVRAYVPSRGLGLVTSGMVARGLPSGSRWNPSGFDLGVSPGVSPGITLGGDREAVFAPPF